MCFRRIVTGSGILAKRRLHRRRLSKLFEMDGHLGECREDAIKCGGEVFAYLAALLNRLDSDERERHGLLDLAIGKGQRLSPCPCALAAVCAAHRYHRVMALYGSTSPP